VNWQNSDRLLRGEGRLLGPVSGQKLRVPSAKPWVKSLAKGIAEVAVRVRKDDFQQTPILHPQRQRSSRETTTGGKGYWNNGNRLAEGPLNNAFFPRVIFVSLPNPKIVAAHNQTGLSGFGAKALPHGLLGLEDIGLIKDRGEVGRITVSLSRSRD